MTAQITIGWWAVPLAITIVLYAFAIAKIPPSKPSSYFPGMEPVIIGFFNLTFATVFSLVAWLIWALLP